MKPVYRVVGLLSSVLGSEEMFSHRAFWQFSLSVIVTMGGLVLFGRNYE
jgi:hypothetical protein